MEKAILAAGCFWGVEVAFRKVKGVVSTSVGYSGGTVEEPSYEEVCMGRTGHAEVVEVEFDPAKVTFRELLEVFWNSHDPTTVNRQGPDVGTQYRSAIFFLDEAQRETAAASLEEAEKSGRFHGRIVTEITQASTYYPAEEYHQQYIEKQQKKVFGMFR